MIVRGLLVIFGSLWCASASAQESICDPENPACVEAEPEPEPKPGEPELTAPEEPLAPPLVSAFERARFLGAWGTRLDVDAAFEGLEEDIVESSSYLDLGLEFDPRDDLRIVVQGQFRHWAGGKKHPDNTNLLVNAQRVRASYDVRLGEAYVLWRTDQLNIALGNIVTRWGSTDLTRPGDVLNPTDQTTISAMDAAERIPQLTLDLTYTGRGWALQGLLVPFFTPNRAWAFGRDTSLFNPRNPIISDQFPIDGLADQVIDPSIQDDIQPLLGASRVPDEVPRNVSLGSRLTATFANTDVGVGAWMGWDRTPFIFIDEDLRAVLNTLVRDGQVLQDLNFVQFVARNPELLDHTRRLGAKSLAGDELFASEYRRSHMLLLDAARYVGPIGVRTDVALFAQKTYMTEGFQAVRRPTISPSLGVSWERIQSEDDVVTLTLEGFWQKPLAADHAVTESLVPQELRGDPEDPLLLVGDGIYGVAGAFLWALPWIKTHLQLGGVYNISHGDVIGSVKLERRFFGWLTAGIGYTFFEGPDPKERLTIGGLYDNNDQVSVALSGVF